MRAEMSSWWGTGRQLRVGSGVGRVANVSNGGRGYHFFGQEGTTCDIGMTPLVWPTPPLHRGVGCLSRPGCSPGGWYPLTVKVVPVLTDTDTPTRLGCDGCRLRVRKGSPWPWSSWC